MEPLTALSVACNVLQLAEQGIKSAVACKELYDKGSLDEHNTLDQNSTSLNTLSKQLQDELKQTVGSVASARLHSAAQDVIKSTNELRIELNKLKLSKSQGVRRLGEAFAKALKTLVKSGKIARLQQNLEAYEKTLHLTITKEQ